MDDAPIAPVPTPAIPQLKTASNAYLGFIHYLLGGLIYFYILLIVGVIIISPIPKGVFSTYLGYALGLFCFWLAVWFSAKRLKKKYIINDPKRVSYLATVWNFGVVAFIIILLGSVILNTEQQTGQTSLGLGSSVSSFAVEVLLLFVQMFLFYWLSKKYLSETKV